MWLLSPFFTNFTRDLSVLLIFSENQLLLLILYILNLLFNSLISAFMFIMSHFNLSFFACFAVLVQFLKIAFTMGFPPGSVVKVPACNAGDLGLIPGSGRSPGEGNGNPLQYSCLENPMDGGAWWATVHGVSKSRTRLSNFTFSLSLTSIHFSISI